MNLKEISESQAAPSHVYSSGVLALDPEHLCDVLAEPGFGYFPEAVKPDFLELLIGEAESLRDDGALREACIGSGSEKEYRPEIRSDRILWLNEEVHQPVLHHWLSTMSLLRETLKRSLLMPLDGYEGHLACYPAGGFYKPHLDRHRDSTRRLITLIVYLNRDWTADQGGGLRLFTDPVAGVSGPFIEVPPVAGTLVVFRSVDFWHEVLPTTRDRFSLTGWLRPSG